ncbi:MAG TPA: sigma-70 family RNA polymerase sigma factor [Gemmatimonadaceae bacterium]|nr:sigma-70 family RNA polymerase sigma factor [Gemmatimonadaceae bacterium]
MREPSRASSGYVGRDTLEESRSWLVLRAQTGDREAMDLLLRDIEHEALRYITRLMGQSADREDVLQDVLMTIVRKLSQLRDPLLFRPWVYRIASRECFRALKAIREWDALIADDFDPDSSHGVANPDEEVLDSVDAATMVNTISLSSRTVIVLHYFEGLSQREIAETLSLSIGTVKSRIAYGLTQLRAQLTERG